MVLSLVGFNFSLAQNEIIKNAQQTKIIKGVVSNEEGPLPNAVVLLKDTRFKTETDKKGNFTFPQPLKVNDVLEFRYLGYKTENFIIKPDTQFVEITMKEANVEMIGALNSGKPYKSKRKN